jgi:hypothetical protein
VPEREYFQKLCAPAWLSFISTHLDDLRHEVSSEPIHGGLIGERLRPGLDARLSSQSHVPGKVPVKSESALPSQIARDFPRVRQARIGS